ncbi:transporter substrate-binding domain-containing protein [Phyllobacterium myrsinacearum]|uniref:Amidase n=2 Tax=Pseudomonadota TaxID=1224 RepID=A0A2S9JF39_9HYPH|nr:transporter substrate-binding domain-containing protein [Phyllobacterium myrsinacearum]PRD51534.1 amidase [Phyllobacterium myrsinacearum]PWV89621.1 amino acid/amide ABC transporter substrate-binding protein (HAAT family) [Phyllobacterium myrsinacearum]RZU99788.1 amino acid/amide ABC transporter substrate-binding protein (HAAT family) [Phyllobacterium myrsinacearum]
MADAVKIGILYSTTGPYGAIGRDSRDGAEFAMDEIRAAYPGAVEPVFIDPQGHIPDYLEGARSMLREHGCRHIVGTITSIARKEVIPLVEKHDGLLWYMCPYEGFEANENVIYTGACPNQHLLPLFDYLLPRYGRRPYLVGANYVWGWEMNRLARELISKAGGEVLGERYLPLEETAVERIILDIEQRRPSFVLNNLIGPASYAFLRAFRALGDRDSAFLPENCPVVSCDLSECELDEIGAGVATGHFSVAAYFDSLVSPENLAFKAAASRRFGPQRRLSNIFASAYAAVKLCGETIVAAGTDEPQAVRRALSGVPLSTVFGPVRIDPDTNHMALPFLLGRINDLNGFDIVNAQPAIAADPYLTRRRTKTPVRLRIVS